MSVLPVHTLLTRIIAAFLLPCLVADPSLANLMECRHTAGTPNIFQQQALAAPFLAMLKPFLKPERRAETMNAAAAAIAKDPVEHIGVIPPERQAEINLEALYAKFAQRMRNIRAGEKLAENENEFERVRGMFPNGQAKEADIWGTTIDDFPKDLSDDLQRITEEWLALLPQVAHFRTSHYHIGVTMIQDQDLSNQGGDDIHRLSAAEIDAASREIRAIVATTPGPIRLRPRGIRLGPDGSLIFVFDFSQEIHRLRQALRDGILKVTPKHWQRPKPMIHMTLVRLLENVLVDEPTAEAIRNFAEKYEDVRSVAGMIEVHGIHLSHEIRWMHEDTEFDTFLPFKNTEGQSVPASAGAAAPKPPTGGSVPQLKKKNPDTRKKFLDLKVSDDTRGPDNRGPNERRRMTGQEDEKKRTAAAPEKPRLDALKILLPNPERFMSLPDIVTVWDGRAPLERILNDSTGRQVIAIYGIPDDTGAVRNMGRPGANNPSVALQLLFDEMRKAPLYENVKIVYLGHIPPAPQDPARHPVIRPGEFPGDPYRDNLEESYQRVIRVVSTLRQMNPNIALGIIGGDDGYSYANFYPYTGRTAYVALANHTMARTLSPQLTHRAGKSTDHKDPRLPGPNSGTFATLKFSHPHPDSLLQPDQVWYFALDRLTQFYHIRRDWLRKRGVQAEHLLRVEQVQKMSQRGTWSSFIHDTLMITAKNVDYLHAALSILAVDVREAPGRSAVSNTQGPLADQRRGVSAADAEAYAHAAGRAGAAVLDIMETAPALEPKDGGQPTSQLAARLLHAYLRGWEEKFMAIPPVPPTRLFGQSIFVDEAAMLLNVSRRTIYNWIKSGKLKAIRVRNSTRVLMESVNEVLNSQGARPSGEPQLIRALKSAA